MLYMCGEIGMNLTKKNDFIITCKKCKSTSIEIYQNGGGCDSCGYGQSMTISCNNCHNVENVT